MGQGLIVPVLGIMTGIIVPIAVFVWLYFESKDKNKTILEISRNIDDPSKVEDLTDHIHTQSNPNAMDTEKIVSLSCKLHGV